MATSLPLTSLAIVVVASLHAAPAQAASRAWVAGTGTDQPGCGPLVSPCRTPQYAHDNIVDAGGEIDFLDPAGYGTIVITKAIGLVNDGVGTTGLLAPAGVNAVTINAGPSDAIQLRGVTIEGAGIGLNGIVFNSGGSLTVTNCVAQNFFDNKALPPATAFRSSRPPATPTSSFRTQSSRTMSPMALPICHRVVHPARRVSSTALSRRITETGSRSLQVEPAAA